MALINLLIVLIIVDGLLRVANLVLAMRPRLKRIVNGVVTAAVILWLLQVFGLVGTGGALLIGA